MEVMESCFSEKESGNLEGLYGMGDNEEGDAVESSVMCVSIVEVVQASNELQTGGPWIYICVIGVDCCDWGSRNLSDV